MRDHLHDEFPVEVSICRRSEFINVAFHAAHMHSAHTEALARRSRAVPILVPAFHVVDLALMRFDDAFCERAYLRPLRALQRDFCHRYRSFMVRNHLHDKVLVNIVAHHAPSRHHVRPGYRAPIASERVANSNPDDEHDEADDYRVLFHTYVVLNDYPANYTPQLLPCLPCDWTSDATLAYPDALE